MLSGTISRRLKRLIGCEPTLSAYIQCHSSTAALYECLKTFRTHYPTEQITLVSDCGDDFSAFGRHFDLHSYRSERRCDPRGGLGRAGIEEYLARIHEHCRRVDSDYVVLLEEDVVTYRKARRFPRTDCAGPRLNPFTPELNRYLRSLNASSEKLGYGMCGGSIFDRRAYIESYRGRKIDWEEMGRLDDRVVSYSDAALTLLFLVNGYSYGVWNEVSEAHHPDVSLRIYRDAAFDHNDKRLYARSPIRPCCPDPIAGAGERPGPDAGAASPDVSRSARLPSARPFGSRRLPFAVPPCNAAGLRGENHAMPITACIFDAYGTLFDVGAAARVAASEPGAEPWATRWPELASDWRRKQLEYTWIRAGAGAHADFWQVTQDSLDWAMERHGLREPDLRDRLLALYRELAAFPEVPEMLDALRAARRRCAILSNGSPAMLAAAVRSAGLDDLIEVALSVEEVGVFKPDPRVYGLVEARLGARRTETLFVSANGWDACAGAAFGFMSVWINRDGAPMDRLHGRPAHVLPDLAALPDLVARIA